MKAKLKGFTSSVLAIVLVVSLFNISGWQTAEAGQSNTMSTVLSLDEPNGLIDMIKLGDAQSEQEHELVATDSQAVIGAQKQAARVSLPKSTPDYFGGDLTFTMQVDPHKQNYFSLKLWGSDASLYRAFMAIDNQVYYPAPLVIAKLSPEPPIENRFYYSTIPIPLEKSKGKTELTITIRTTVSTYPYSSGTFTKAYTTKMTQPSNKYYAAFVHTNPSLTDEVIQSTGAHESYLPPVRDNGGKGSDLDPGSQAAKELQDKIYNDVATVLTEIVRRDNDTAQYTTANWNTTINGHGNGTMLPPYSQNDINLHNLKYFSEALLDNGSERYDEHIKSYGIDQLLAIMQHAMDRNIINYLNMPGTVQMGGHQSAWGGYYQGLGMALWNVNELFVNGRYEELGGKNYASFDDWFNGDEQINWQSKYASIANFYYDEEADKPYPFLLEKSMEDIGEASHVTSRRSAYEEVLWLNYSYARTHQYTLTPLTNQIMFMQYGAWMSNAGLIVINSDHAENYYSALRHLYRASGVLSYYDIDIVNGTVEAEMNSNGGYLGVLELHNIEAFNDSTQFDAKRNYIGENRKAFGEHYYMITDAGLTRETNYVAGYGEHSDHLVHAWRWVKQAAERYTDPTFDKGADETELLRKALQTSNARAHMKYADTDTAGYRAFRLEATIEARGPFYPYDAGYHVKMNHNGTASAGSLSPFLLAYLKKEIENDFEKYKSYFGADFKTFYGYAEDAVGYAQQMLADNQLSPFISKSFAPDFHTLAGYQYVLNHDRVSTLLPSTNLDWYSEAEKLLLSEAGFDEEELYSNSFYDIEDTIVYFRDDKTVYMMMLEYKSDSGLNGTSRVHAISSNYDRIAMVDHEVLYTPSGYWNFGTDWTNVGYNLVFDSATYLPDGSTNMQEGEIFPVPSWKGYEHLIKLTGPKTGTPFGGHGEFYSLQYGQYVIAMNTTRDSFENTKNYEVVLPSGYQGSTIFDKMSNSWLTVRNGKVTVSPSTAVALDLESPAILNDVPVAPVFVGGTGSDGSVALTWAHSAGSNAAYEIVRSESKNGQYQAIATVGHNDSIYVDKKVVNGKTYYYKIRGISDTGKAGNYSPYAEIKVSGNALGNNWAYDTTAWELDSVIHANHSLAVVASEEQGFVFSGDALNDSNALFAYTSNISGQSEADATPVNGDFQMIAEVISGEQIGIMLKESLDVRSRGAYLTLDEQGNYRFVYRQQPNFVRIDDMRPDFYDVYNNLNPVEVIGTVEGAKWLKVERKGLYVYAYVSVDGEEWIGIGEIGYPLYPEVDPDAGDSYLWADDWHKMKELGKIYIPMLNTIYAGIASKGAGEVSNVQVLPSDFDGTIPDKVQASISSDNVNRQITLNWKHVLSGDHYMLFRTQDEQIAATNPLADNSDWELLDGELRDIVFIDTDYHNGSNGKVYYTIVAKNAQGIAGEPSDVLEGEINLDGIQFPASVWKAVDVNTPSAGHDLMSGSTVNMHADGLRFWQTDGNSYRFLYQEIDAKSEGTFIVRVNPSQFTGDHLGEALLVRNDNGTQYNGDSRHRAVRINASRGIFGSYQVGNKSGRVKDFAGQNEHAWLRLETHADSELVDIYYAPVTGNETDYPSQTEWNHIVTFNNSLDGQWSDMGNGLNDKWYVGVGLATGGVKRDTSFYNVAPVFELPEVSIDGSLVTPTKNITVQKGSALELELAVKDAFEQHALPLSAIEINGQLPAGAVYDSAAATLNWTPASSGRYVLSFKARDQASLNDFYGGIDITVEVLDETKIPVLDEIGSKQYIAEKPLSLQLSASIKDVATVASEEQKVEAEEIGYAINSITDSAGNSYTAQQLGINFNAASGLLTWTPSKLHTGKYSFVFEVRSEQLVASQQATITIIGAPLYSYSGVHATAIANGETIELLAENTVIIPLSVQDPTDRSYYSYVEQLPEGVVYNGSSLVWKPSFAQSSAEGTTHTFQIVAYNTNFKNELTISFNVKSPEPNAPDFRQNWTATALSNPAVADLKATVGGVANSEITLNNASHYLAPNYNQGTGRSSFVYQKLQADSEIVARITGYSPASRWAGLMISDFNGPNPLDTGINRVADLVMMAVSETQYKATNTPFKTDSVLAFARSDNPAQGDFPNKGFATGETDLSNTYWLKLAYTVNTNGAATVQGYYKVDGRDADWITDASWVYDYSAEQVSKGLYGGVFAAPANHVVAFDNAAIHTAVKSVTASRGVNLTLNAAFDHAYETIEYAAYIEKDGDEVEAGTINNQGVFTWNPDEGGSYLLTVIATAVDSGQIATQQYVIDVVQIDKSELSTYIASLPTLFADDYTSASWAVYEQAFNAARAVLANSSVSQQQIDSSLVNLQSSYDGLIENRVNFPLKDTFVNSSGGGAAQSNGGQSALTILRKDAANDKHQRLGIITFDLSQYEGKQVSEAELQLYSSSSSNAGRRNPLVIAPIGIGSWSESNYSYNMLKTEFGVTNDEELLTFLQGIVDYKTIPIQSADDVQYGWSSDIADWVNGSLTDGKNELTLLLYTDQLVDVHEVNVHTKEASGANAPYRPSLTLSVATNKETLQSLKNTVDGYSAEHYTSSTWAELQLVMTQVADVLSDEDTAQEDINDAYSRLKQALAALVELSGLLELITDGEALLSSDFTSGSYMALQDKLAAAQRFVSESATASKGDVQAQMIALTAAFEQLVDAKALNALIVQIEALEREHYHEASWSYAQDEVNIAKQALQKSDATKEEIDNCYAHLSGVRVALESYAKLQLTYDAAASVDVDAASYTAHSYTRLADALQAAEMLLETGGQLADMIDSARAAILGAEKKLVSIELLIEVISSAELLSNDDEQYTALTWATFEGRLDAAQELLQQAADADIQISKTAVAYTVNGLIAAHVALLITLDVSELLSAITEADEQLGEMEEQDYSAASWLAVAQSYDQAIQLRTRALAGDELLTQTDLDTAAAELPQKFEALVYVVDLYVVIMEASQLEQGRYTFASWSLVADALEQTQELAARASDAEQAVTQAEIDSAQQAVEASLLELVTYESLLTSALAEHNHYVQRVYTGSSWSVYVAAKAAVQTLLDRVVDEVLTELVTDEEVDAAIAALDKAAIQLTLYVATSPTVPVIDRESLQNAISAAHGLVEADYVASSWHTFIAALNDAKAVMENSAATQEMIHAAAASLNKAQQQLKPVDAEPVDPEQSGNNEIQLTDVEGHWAQSAIERLVKLGAITGYGDDSFRPEHAITRAEFVTILVKLLALEAGSAIVFDDTKSHWANEYISIAASVGLVNGKQNYQFKPNDEITREEMAAIIARILKLNADHTSPDFKDDNHISNWAKEAVSAIVAQGVMNGYPDGSFKPSSEATRAEAVTVIIRMLDVMEQHKVQQSNE